jgi:hypothetical protein
MATPIETADADTRTLVRIHIPATTSAKSGRMAGILAGEA